MPLLWGKTRCAEAVGWQDRVITKLTVAGGTGAVVGSLLSVVQRQPLVRFTAASTASFLMLAGCFSAVQEASRLARCRDSPANSVLAGAATGALLYKSHGRPGAPGAIIVAAIGGVAHLFSAKMDAAGGLQKLLISMDLLDPPPELPEEQQQQQQQSGGMGGSTLGGGAAAQRGEAEAEAERRWWHTYMPVHKMTDAEWEQYRAQQSEAQRKRIETALAGGLPVMVDRHQQQQEQQDAQTAAEER